MKKPNIRPLKTRIIAVQIMEEEKTVESTTGLILNLSDEDHSLVKDLVAKKDKLKPTNKLTILRVGKDVEEVKEDDILIWDGRATRIEHDGETYIVTEEKNGIAIVEQPTYS